MRVRAVRFLALALAIGLVAPLFGQPGRQGGGGVSESMLLGQKSVQEELKLTEDQVKKIETVSKDIGEKMRDVFKEKDKDKRTEAMTKINEERTKMMADVLKPEQTKRLKQITVQVGGLSALSRKEVTEALKFTEKQTADLKALADDLAKDRTELFKDVGRDQKKREEASEKLRTLGKEMTTKFLSGLTADQKKAYKDLTGDEFKGKIDFGMGMRPRPNPDKQ